MSSQGGKREGAGRKSRFGGDKTIAMRVPEPLKPVLESWLDEYRSLRSINHSSIGDIALLGEALKNLSLPLFASRVPAGSPVAADDLKEADIDLNQHLVRKPASMPDRLTAASIARAPSSGAVSGARPPRKPPSGVRLAETITTGSDV